MCGWIGRVCISKCERIHGIDLHGPAQKQNGSSQGAVKINTAHLPHHNHVDVL